MKKSLFKALVTAFSYQSSPGREGFEHLSQPQKWGSVVGPLTSQKSEGEEEGDEGSVMGELVSTCGAQIPKMSESSD